MILETKRLILRELEQSDFDDVCLLLQDPEVMYAYEGAFNNKEVQEWLDKQAKRYTDYGFGLWGMIEKESGILIGQCGITMQAYNSQSVPEVGYLLRKAFWHKGYATEAAQACKAYAFKTLQMSGIYSIIRDTNRASQQVALRNGMQKTDSFVKHYRNIDMLHHVFYVENTKYNHHQN